MSHAALTQRYRPQTFADVAGQATLKAILCRAAAEDRVAPAYLFSGTRGVGKTTIARIFAKALNCKNAGSSGLPAGEPCNDCDNCRAITLGGSVDVVEIDGASNRGIDDVRRLKESVGYAPMDGRYKIFIIDEAHMLSREAFNALLKTLEEPPARVTFIMATTESHKFPVTILSRCQHYVFKRLSDAELEGHLTKILGLENFPFDEAAIRLIVRRAAGSVRDSMSLLGQVLALGGSSLNEAETRMVLGLAGQELFFKLLAHIKAADCPSLSLLVREMLDQGLDIGFFLRELSSMWRNLFMLRQSGEAARAVVDLPAAEVERWLAEAAALDLGHIHAAWQMTLEGQRRVLTSLEPALALELLLLNLAMLPRLLNMEQISLLSRKFANEGAEKKSPLIDGTAETDGATEQVEQLTPTQVAEHTTDSATNQTSGHILEQPAPSAPKAPASSITPENSLAARAAVSQPSSESAPSSYAQTDSTPQLSASQPEAGSDPAVHDTAPGSQKSASPEAPAQGAPEQAAAASGKQAAQAGNASAHADTRPDSPAPGGDVEAPSGSTPNQSASGQSAPEQSGPDQSALEESMAGQSASLDSLPPWQDYPEATGLVPAHEEALGIHNESPVTRAQAASSTAYDDAQVKAASSPGDLASGTAAASGVDAASAAPALQEGTGKPGDWMGFVRFCAETAKLDDGIPASFTALLNKLRANWEGGSVSITPPDVFSAGRLEDKETAALLRQLLSRFCGQQPELKFLPPPNKEQDRQKLREQLDSIPAVQALREKLGAQLIDCAPWRG